jgi:hypothetical protein
VPTSITLRRCDETLVPTRTPAARGTGLTGTARVSLLERRPSARTEAAQCGTQQKSGRDPQAPGLPIDVSPFERQIRGHIVGQNAADLDNLPMPGELVPMLEWSSQVRSLSDEQGDVTFNDTFTTRFGDGI